MLMQKKLLSLAVAVFALCPATNALGQTTKSVTLTEAGTLASTIGDDDKYQITDLTISGPLNGSDILWLRDMAGQDADGFDSEGELANLDLTNASIVEGGDPYYTSFFGDGDYSTENHVIGPYMFQGTHLSTIELPNSVTSIGEYAFASCPNLTSVTVNAPVRSIDQLAFNYSTKLENITLPETLDSLGYMVFSSCIGLKSITIPDGVKELPEHAFDGCSSLTEVQLPANLEKIGNSAFINCTSLKDIDIPATLTDFGQLPFMGCTSLEAVNVEDGNANYKSDDGVVFDNAMSKLLLYPAGKKTPLEYTVPESVTSVEYGAFNYNPFVEKVVMSDNVSEIGMYAFENCSGLKSVTLPTTLSKIEQQTFSGCSSLSDINIPAGITEIGQWAFQNCSSLTNFNVPDGVTEIGESVFDGCSSLASVTLPEGITSIGMYAFQSCSSLPEIHLPSTLQNINGGAFWSCFGLKDVYVDATTPPSCRSNVFGNQTPSQATLHVPAGCVTDYQNATTWSSFTNIVENASTGISSIHTDQDNTPWYSLGGFRVGKPTRKGIYIHNGKKVLKR